MEKTYLDKIKEAEDKASDILRAAINKSEQMLHDAEKSNAEYEKKGIDSIENNYKSLLKKAENEASKLVQKADAEYALKCEELKSLAAPYVNEAVEFVMEKVTDGNR